MALEGDGKIHRPQVGKTMIYISRFVAEDSAFPFEKGESVHVRIDSKAKRVIIEKA